MSVKSFVIACCPPFLRSTLDRIENSPIGYRLAKGMFWSLSGAVISRGLMLVASVLVARMLGTTGYGELGIIQSTVGMFGVLAGFGLGLTATKYVAELRETDPERTGRIISLSWLVATATGSLMSLGLFFMAPWLAEHTINAPQLTGVLRIGALILFINALNGAQTGALSGFEAFKTIAHVNIFVGLISFPILIGGVYFGGLTGAVWALAINLGVNWLLNHLALRKEAHRYNVPLTFINCSREMSVLWKFSLPAAFSMSMVLPANWICSALLVNQPDGYGEMGIFNAAYQWQLAILFIPNWLGHVVLSLLSNLSAESSLKEYRQVLRFNVFLNGGISLAIVLPLVLFAHFVMSAYGPGFERGVIVFRVLAFTALLMTITNVIGLAIASKGKMWVRFTFNALWAIVLIATTVLMLQWGYGALGLAYAYFIAYLFHAIWHGLYIRRTLRRSD